MPGWQGVTGNKCRQDRGLRERSRDHYDTSYDTILDHLVDGVPLLDSNLLWSRSDLRGDKLLEVSDRVVFVALHPHLPAQARERALAAEESVRARGGVEERVLYQFFDTIPGS